MVSIDPSGGGLVESFYGMLLRTDFGWGSGLNNVKAAFFDVTAAFFGGGSDISLNLLIC